MPQNGIIGVHGIQNDQKLQKMEHYFKMHHLILCRSEGVKTTSGLRDKHFERG